MSAGVGALVSMIIACRAFLDVISVVTCRLLFELESPEGRNRRGSGFGGSSYSAAVDV